jgi:hypothetical protein
MNNLWSLDKEKFYSIDISNVKRNKFEINSSEINNFISIKKVQSKRTEPYNFYKPISKYLDF